jgi:hypothetical protein
VVSFPVVGLPGSDQSKEVRRAPEQTQPHHLIKADEEMDVLHASLTREVANEEMSAAIAGHVTLLARFYVAR